MKKILLISIMTVLMISGLAWAGSGTENDPYTIAEALALSESATEYWAKGYIVGGAYNNFDSPWTSDYSISCADNDSESDVDNCLQVKLESDGGRTTWGLSSDSSNFQKLIKFQGNRDAYGLYPSFEHIDNADISEVALENQPPVLATVGNKAVVWSNTLTFSVSASDTLDGDDVALYATDLPSGATFPGVTNATTASSTFTWADAGPMGVYTTTFWAVDADGTSSETITITVGDGSTPSDIAFQGFEGTASDTWGITAANYVLSTAGASDTPANQRVRTGSYSWQPGETDELSETLELDEVDITSYSDVVMTVYLSATSTNITDNNAGIWSSDTLGVYLALDGGAYPGSADITVMGNEVVANSITGAVWSYDATGIAATTAGVSRTFAPANGGGVVADGVAKVQIAVPAGVTSIQLKAVSSLEAYGYYWNIDDISLVGINDGGASDFPPTISVSPTGLDKAVAVSNNLSFTISGSEIPNDAGDELRIWATDVPAGATFAGATNPGSASSVFNWTPTEAGSTTVRFFVGDKDGTNQLDVGITAYDLGAGGAAYGLAVGLNEYSSSYIDSGSWLDGCVPDANHIFTNILKRGEWNALTAQKKLDSAGTKAAIRAAITSYASTAVAGDTFFYYHSSHGGQNSGTSVYLCTYDGDYQDTELAADLSQFAAGVKVVVMVDACHSGGLFKSVEVGTRAVRPAKGTWDLAGIVSGIMDEQRAAKLATGKRDVLSRVSSSEIGWITAADYDQYSWDGGPNGGGVFTDKVIEGWTNPVPSSCDLNGDAYANFYELWDYSWDVANNSEYEYTTAMAHNTNVLLSAIAGWVGATAPVTSNQPPSIILNPAGLSKTVVFDEALSFSVTATDMDGAAVSLVASNLPSGATAPSNNGTGTASTTLNWTPVEAQIGSYDVTFTATDLDGTTSTTVHISVTEPVVLIPVASVANLSSNSFTLNWAATTGGTAYQVQVATDSVFAVDSGGNLMVNGGFEAGDNTGWDKFESGYTVVSTSPQEGSYAVECVSGLSTREIMQTVDITGDGVTEYEISYYYRVTDGDGEDVRIWADWDVGGQDSGDELQVSDDYNANTSEWTKVTYHVVPASGANTLNFEIRTYKNATVYLDNFFVGVSGGARAPKAILVDQSVSALTLDVTGLDTETPYYARVRATGGTWSDTVMATTTASGAMEPISALISPTNGTLSLEIPTQIGTDYAMECCTNLWGTQVWAQVGSSIAGTGSNIVFQDPDPSAVKCYYRIVAP